MFRVKYRIDIGSQPIHRLQASVLDGGWKSWIGTSLKLSIDIYWYLCDHFIKQQTTCVKTVEWNWPESHGGGRSLLLSCSQPPVDHQDLLIFEYHQLLKCKRLEISIMGTITWWQGEVGGIPIIHLCLPRVRLQRAKSLFVSSCNLLKENVPPLRSARIQARVSWNVVVQHLVGRKNVTHLFTKETTNQLSVKRKSIFYHHCQKLD